MGGPPAEQIIAGVVLSERLAVTMYGAIHRAQFSGQRNLRGLVVDPKLLAESSFRLALTDGKTIAKVTALEHPCIVPTFAVEQGGADVVVVTRGVGRYVSVQDVMAASRANRGQAGKLERAVAAGIAKAVVEALAAAHKANIVHGAVHPRSVLVDEDGAVRLGDFVVGRALTTAVAQGADSSLWRGLAGFLAPELVVGEDPTPPADVFAVGALLFTMLSGEVPPGTLHVSPAVERLVQRALDTDVTRRYRNASDLLENMLEAFEDDHWEIADTNEIIRAAGLSRSDSNIDDATEDLLASLGEKSILVTPTRPSMDLRASEISARASRGQSTGNRLDALLADLDDARELTQVEDKPFTADPISEIIKKQKPRVPSLDDPDDDVDHTPLPPPERHSDADLRRSSTSGGGQARPNTSDEQAAMNALTGLDGNVRRVSTAAEQATVAAERLEQAAKRAEAAAVRVETPRAAIAKVNLAEMPDFSEQPTPRLKSRALGVISLLVLIAGVVGFYYIYKDQQAKAAAHEQEKKDKQAAAEAETKRLTEAQRDKGTIQVTVLPSEANEASVWLKLGRSGPTFATLPLTSSQMHRIRIELDGYQPVDTEVLAANWSGTGDKRKASVNITLKAVGKDKAGKSLAEPLPARPPNLAVEPKDFQPGEGPIHIETSPPGAEVWLLIGYGNTGVSFPTIAGRPYELRALDDGWKPGYTQITEDEWRDGGNPNVPIDSAKKKAVIEKQIEMIADPSYVAPKKRGK